MQNNCEIEISYHLSIVAWNFRSSRSQMFFKIVPLKVSQRRCFPVKFATFLTTPFFPELEFKRIRNEPYKPSYYKQRITLRI